MKIWQVLIAFPFALIVLKALVLGIWGDEDIERPVKDLR